MKKIFNITLASFAVIALALSCTKEVAIPDEQPLPKNNQEEATTPSAATGEPITITASLSDILTKVSFDPSYDANGKPTGLALTWAEGDQLRIYNHADHSEYSDFTLKAGSVGQKVGSFTGTPVSATSWDVEVLNGALNFAEQTQPSDGVTSGLKYRASAEDVPDLSNIDLTDVSNVLAITAKMPSTAVAAAIKSVDITASNAIFNSGTSLTITLTTKGDADADGILHLFANLPSGVTDIPSGTTLLVHFNAPETAHTVYTRFISFDSATSFAANKMNTININATQSDQHAGTTSCDGTTSAKAYLIGDKYQMDYMHTAMVSGTTYFKLVDNVDMAGISWTPLNNAGPYDKVVNFDGNNMTVRNLGGTMFYVFKGTAENFTLDYPTISAANKKGAFAGFIQGIDNFVTNVDVSNVSTFAGSNGPCGGLVGLVNNGSEGETSATFDGCDVSNVVVNSAGSSGMAGGLIGSVENKVVIKDCTYSGNTVANTYDFVGGLVGKATAEISITGSSVSSATLSGRDAVGGLVGHCEAGGSLTSCSVSADVNGRNYIGGVVGRESTASGKTFSISKCSFKKGSSGLSATNQYAGGILGNQYGAGTVTIENCYVDSPVSADNAWAGGISSNHYNGTLTIGKCYVMGSVSALYGAGGIVGQVRVTNLTINPCAVYVSSITATDNTATEHESSGTIVAYGYNVKVTIVRNCWYDQTLTFTECTGNTGSPSSWCPSRQGGLSNEKISGGTPHSKIYPYWGRYTNPSDYPLNKMCKEILEFSSTDWDLDVNPPTLK